MPTTTYLDSTLAVSAIGSRTDAAGADVTDYTAEEARFAAQILTGGYLQPELSFVVREAATPNMSVVVGSGTAKADYYVVAGQVGGQGNYIVRLDAASVSVQVPAADASQQRRDEVYLVVQDDTYDASAHGLPRLGYRKGDLGGAAPGPDAGWEACALLASYPVAAGAVEVTDEVIVDERVPSVLRGDLAVTDHGGLTGLGDDDHPQYHTDARGDIRYYLKSQVDTSLGGKANTTHAHAAGDVTSGTFNSARIPSTLGATTIAGGLTVNGAASANSLTAGTVSVGNHSLTATSIYVGAVATASRIYRDDLNSGVHFGGVVLADDRVESGTFFAGKYNSAFNFKAQNGPGAGDFRAYWTGTQLQFARNDTNAVVKTFVIDHPTGDEERFLVHATTESPHNGVEYWGDVELVGGRAVVELPDYFEALCAAENRQVQVTVVLPDEEEATAGEDTDEDGILGAPAVQETATLLPVAASVPRDGRFRIACGMPDGTRVAWLVKAVRKDVPPLVAEPLRAENNLFGDGPYTYLVPKDAG